LQYIRSVERASMLRNHLPELEIETSAGIKQRPCFSCDAWVPGVISRAIVLADASLWRFAILACSARWRRVAYCPHDR
jgi:hypothetical protein